MAPCVLLCDVNLAIGAKALHVTVLWNSNKLATLDCSTSIYIPYESSMCQLSDDIFLCQLRLGDKLWLQNYCHNTGRFYMTIARMTSQIRP